MDLDQIFSLIKLEPGAGAVQSVLLLMIWLNIRSLKNAIVKIEEGHDERLSFLESKTVTHENRIAVLENK